MNAQTGNIGSRMAKGAAWMVGMRFFDRSIGLISTIVLARLLVPADFGLVALATSVIAMLEIWSEFGFDLALIRDQKADKRHYDTAWTLSLLRGLFVAALVAGGASAAAGFFGDMRLEGILYVLALMSLLEGGQSVRVVEFRKELDLHKEFRFLMTGRVIQFLVTIALAFLWRDHWALVAGILANRLVRFVLSYVMAPYRPRLTLAGLSDLFGFSKWIVCNSVINFVTTKLDTFVLGRMVGVAPVGIYGMAYEVSNMATTELVWPISRALFPGFAKITHDPEELKRAYNRSLALIVLIALPATVGIALTAEYFVPLLLGAKWLTAIPVIQVLAIYGGLRVLVANTGSVYLAINRPYLVTYIGLGNLAVLAPALILLVDRFGAVGAAWAVVAGSVPMVFMMFAFNARYLALPASETIPHILRPLLSVSAMALPLLVLRDVLPPSNNLLTLAGEFAIMALVGAASYISAIVALWRLLNNKDSVEPIVIDFVLAKLPRRARV